MRNDSLHRVLNAILLGLGIVIVVMVLFMIIVVPEMMQRAKEEGERRRKEEMEMLGIHEPHNPNAFYPEDYQSLWENDPIQYTSEMVVHGKWNDVGFPFIHGITWGVSKSYIMSVFPECKDNGANSLSYQYSIERHSSDDKYHSGRIPIFVYFDFSKDRLAEIWIYAKPDSRFEQSDMRNHMLESYDGPEYKYPGYKHMDLYNGNYGACRIVFSAERKPWEYESLFYGY